MNDDQRVELETRLQALLCGDLAPGEIADLMATVTNDAASAAALRDMTQMQQASRASVLGAGQTAPSVPAAVRVALAELHARASQGAAGNGGAKSKLSRSWRDKLFWPLAVAAALLMGLLVRPWIAPQTPMVTDARPSGTGQLPVTSPLQAQPTTNHPAAVQPAPPAISGEALSGLRQIWGQMVEQNTSRKPWFCLSEGAGELGYVAVEPLNSAAQQALVLRCLIVDRAGRQVKEISFVLPEQQQLRLAVPVAGGLEREPVELVVWFAGDEAGVDLSVGSDAAGRVGVRGRTRVGEGNHEVGQFQLHGETMRVFLDATPLTGGMT